MNKIILYSQLTAKLEPRHKNRENKHTDNFCMFAREKRFVDVDVGTAIGNIMDLA